MRLDLGEVEKASVCLLHDNLDDFHGFLGGFDNESPLDFFEHHGETGDLAEALVLFLFKHAPTASDAQELQQARLVHGLLVLDLRQVLAVKLFEALRCLGLNHDFVEHGTLLGLDVAKRLFLEQILRADAAHELRDRVVRVDELLFVEQAPHHVSQLSLAVKLHVRRLDQVELVVQVDQVVDTVLVNRLLVAQHLQLLLHPTQLEAIRGV